MILKFRPGNGLHELQQAAGRADDHPDQPAPRRSTPLTIHPPANKEEHEHRSSQLYSQPKEWSELPQGLIPPSARGSIGAR